MKTFELKVSDLLKDPGKIDSIDFEKLFSENIENLSKDGISGSLTFQSINDTTILFSVENLKCKIRDNCDTCLEDYDREVFCEEYKTKFEIPNDEYMQDDESPESEEVFPINPKSETINIEDFLRQAIFMQEPFLKKCDACEKISLETEDEDIDPFSSSANVTFS